MHIPDGYLSPQTCAIGCAVALPAVGWASYKVRVELRSRQVPTLAMLSAASFLIMMVNLPVPGGTTAHAVGATIIAILLGPWAAVVAIAVALLFQALIFADGGVLTWAVNVINMGVILPFSGLAVYRALAGMSPPRSRRRALAAAAGGYTGMLVTALAVGAELGVQPAFFHTADGTPLYSPYPLGTALSAMLLSHLVAAGPAEALLTGAVLAAVARTRPDLVVHAPAAPVSAPARKARGSRAAAWARGHRAALCATALLIALTPLGLLAPGDAFGESAPEDLDLGALGLNAVPLGMQRYAAFWDHAVLGGYGASGSHPVAGYLLSGLVGALAVGAATCIVTALGRRLRGFRPRTSEARSA